VLDPYSGLANVYLDGTLYVLDTYGPATQYQQPLRYTAWRPGHTTFRSVCCTCATIKPVGHGFGSTTSMSTTGRAYREACRIYWPY
jgi:hypothetical protein